MPSPTYEVNKPSAYRWNAKNRDRVNCYKLRAYYKAKISDKQWANIKYTFLDILIEDIVNDNNR